MKFKDKLGKFFCTFLVIVLIIIFIPLLLVCALLYLPVDYIEFKRSRYQKDFPRKYSLFSGVHIDNKIYTLIKENNLPIEYYKHDGEYDFEGYFLYNDTLLNFSEPLRFVQEKGQWMLPDEGDEEENFYAAGVEGAEEKMVAWLSFEEAREGYIAEFRKSYPTVSCNKIVFFYEAEPMRECYGAVAVEKLRELDGIVLYEEDALKETIRDYIENN